MAKNHGGRLGSHLSLQLFLQLIEGRLPGSKASCTFAGSGTNGRDTAMLAKPSVTFLATVPQSAASPSILRVTLAVFTSRNKMEDCGRDKTNIDSGIKATRKILARIDSLQTKPRVFS